MRRVRVGTRDNALVDDKDYALVAPYRWYRFKRERNRTSYAYRFVGPNGSPGTSRTPGVSWQYMHTLITGLSQVDHRNGDGLDNRRQNLRQSTGTGQRANTAKQRGRYTSKFKGVSWDTSRGKWQAHIQVHGKGHYLGRFISEMEAAEMYDKAAAEYFGEFAFLNFS